MNRTNRIITLLLTVVLLLIPAFSAAAAEGTGAEIVYFDDPGRGISIMGPGNTDITPEIGILLTEGTRIDTAGGTVELRLVPNGTIFKLAPGTNFAITALQAEGGANPNIFTLLRGKLRTLAARSGRGEAYEIHTPSAVCAVRGTEFINEVGDSGSTVVVRHGTLFVESLRGGKWVSLEGGQGLDTLADLFRPVNFRPEELEALFSGFPFVGADPKNVPGALSDTGETAGDNAGPPAAGSASADIGRPVTEALARERDYERKSYDERSAFGRWVSDYLGGEIGTTTIDGETYSKLVVSPEIEAGDFRMAFYLPIIYVNLFDGGTWYKPGGNNEWSFGADQSGWQNVVTDIWTDLWLKIRYMEYGDPEWNRFYFKFGNLSSMSLGHGALVYQYANDADFPAVRRVGMNLGYERRAGFEAMVDDLADPGLMGLRLSVSPFKSYQAFEVGISGVTDISPVGDIEDPPGPSEYGNPWLLGTGIDFDFLELNTGLLKMVWFADVSAVAPIYREDSVKYPGVDAGPAWDMVWSNGRPTNFGTRTGLRGLFGPVRYSLEYRYWNGVYVPSMFNSMYDRNKVDYIDRFTDYLNQGEAGNDHMGIYGEAYWEILDKERLVIGAAYHWPWEIDNGTVDFEADDYLMLELAVGDRLVKAWGISGSLKYERSKVRQTVSDPGSYSWFDGYTVFSGEIVFPLNPIMSLAVVGGTATRYDGDGDIVLDGTKPEVVPVLNIETRIKY